MADQDSTRLIAPGGRMLPEEVANRSFKSALRGISETDVRTFLRRVADEMGRMRGDEQALRDRIAELEERLRNPEPPSEQQLLDALGEETARVLRSAQDAADEIRSKAEERAALVRREAQDDAKRLREEAELAGAERLAHIEGEAQQARDSAEERVATIIADAEVRAEAIRNEATQEADRVRARAIDAADAHLEDARTSGREMVTEAHTLRERILTDLVTRRALLQEQIEELRTSREALLGAYKVVKETLDAATAALREVEARAAAELAADEPLAVGAGVELDVAALDALLGEPKTHFYDQDAEALLAREIAVGPVPSAGAEVFVMVEADALESAVVAVPADEVPPTDGTMAEQQSGDEEPDGVGVDALFAKLRAARTSAVDDARHVLDDAVPTSNGSGNVDGEVAVDAEQDPTQVTVATAVIELDVEPVATDASSDEALRDAQRAAIDGVAPGLIRNAKRVLQDEQNEMLDALRTAKRTPKSTDVLPDRAVRLEAWSVALAPAVAGLYAAGFEAAGSSGPVPDKAPSSLVAELADQLVSPWRDRLADAIDQQDDNDAVTRVGARFRELRSQALGDAIREVLAAAYARGVYDGAAEGDVLRWIPAEVGHCPDCDDNALEPVIKGAPFPTGQAFPPAHPGCRCLIGTPSVVRAETAH